MKASHPVIDPPPALELLQRVADFLTSELAPAQADSKLRLRTLVAANVVRIAQRELAKLDAYATDGAGHAVPAEWREQGVTLTRLTEELADGRRALTDPDTYAMLLRYVEGKLEIAAPEVPAAK